MTKYIGVDPAFRQNGFYVCVIAGADVTFIKMSSFIDFVALVDSLELDVGDVYICIENSNETNHTFISPSVRKATAREKISRDVGKNQAVSQMAVDYALYRLKIGVYSVSPAEKGMKWNISQVQTELKQNAQIAKNYKGLVSEQDKRDAYKLALLARYKELLYLSEKKYKK